MTSIKKHALVVDDVAFNRRVLRLMLERNEYVVVEAVNGLQAVEKCARDQFDIIFMDIMMPVMNGYEATHLLRSDPAVASTRIVFVSALDQQSDINQAFSAGADDYIMKPVSYGDIKAQLIPQDLTLRTA